MKYIFSIVALLFSLNAAAEQPVVTWDTNKVLSAMPRGGMEQREAINKVNSKIHGYQSFGYKVIELSNGKTYEGAVEKDITSEIADAAGLDIGR